MQPRGGGGYCHPKNWILALKCPPNPRASNAFFVQKACYDKQNSVFYGLKIEYLRYAPIKFRLATWLAPRLSEILFFSLKFRAQHQKFSRKYWKTLKKDQNWGRCYTLGVKNRIIERNIMSLGWKGFELLGMNYFFFSTLKLFSSPFPRKLFHPPPPSEY